jgi:hypothetical protein
MRLELGFEETYLTGVGMTERIIRFRSLYGTTKAATTGRVNSEADDLIRLRTNRLAAVSVTPQSRDLAPPVCVIDRGQTAGNFSMGSREAS